MKYEIGQKVKVMTDGNNIGVGTILGYRDGRWPYLVDVDGSREAYAEDVKSLEPNHIQDYIIGLADKTVEDNFSSDPRKFISFSELEQLCKEFYDDGFNAGVRLAEFAFELKAEAK